MIISCEISPEELKVFMEEAEEHIQLLDEDIIKLENEGTNQELLQEIFRAAHTLKGSSAMLGHERMAEVTHAMESLLDKLRNHKISVNSKIIDALLFALDALKMLKSEITSQRESDVDILAIVNRLNEAAEANSPVDTGEAVQQHTNGGKAEKLITLNKNAASKIAKAQKNGMNVYAVKVFIDSKSEWMAVRSLQIYNDLTAMGDLIASVPGLKEIEQEKVTPEFTAIVCCRRRNDEIEETLKLISDIEKVITAAYGTAEGAELLKSGQAEEKKALPVQDVRDNAAKAGN